MGIMNIPTKMLKTKQSQKLILIAKIKIKNTTEVIMQITLSEKTYFFERSRYPPMKIAELAPEMITIMPRMPACTGL